MKDRFDGLQERLNQLEDRMNESETRTEERLKDLENKILQRPGTSSTPGELPKPSTTLNPTAKETLLLKHVWDKDDYKRREGRWSEFKGGFEDPSEELFWLGLEEMHRMTSKGRWTLRVRVKYDRIYDDHAGVIGDPNAGTFGEAEWGNFTVGPENAELPYHLTVGELIKETNFGKWPVWKDSNKQAFQTRDRKTSEVNWKRTARNGGGWWLGPRDPTSV